MISVPHFIEHVIRPVVTHLGLGGKNVEQLLLGTALQESRLQYLKQLPNGPALGVFQMEPATHEDIWVNYLNFRDGLAHRVVSFVGPGAALPETMIGNLYYAAAMCRVHYRRVPEQLPTAGDLEGQAEYWKEYYNTFQGAGTVEEYIENYQVGTFRIDWP